MIQAANTSDDEVAYSPVADHLLRNMPIAALTHADFVAFVDGLLDQRFFDNGSRKAIVQQVERLDPEDI